MSLRSMPDSVVLKYEILKEKYQLLYKQYQDVKLALECKIESEKNLKSKLQNIQQEKESLSYLNKSFLKRIEIMQTSLLNNKNALPISTDSYDSVYASELQLKILQTFLEIEDKSTNSMERPIKQLKKPTRKSKLSDSKIIKMDGDSTLLLFQLVFDVEQFASIHIKYSRNDFVKKNIDTFMSGIASLQTGVNVTKNNIKNTFKVDKLNFETIKIAYQRISHYYNSVEESQNVKLSTYSRLKSSFILTLRSTFISLLNEFMGRLQTRDNTIYEFSESIVESLIDRLTAIIILLYFVKFKKPQNIFNHFAIVKISSKSETIKNCLVALNEDLTVYSKLCKIVNLKNENIKLNLKEFNQDESLINIANLRLSLRDIYCKMQDYQNMIHLKSKKLEIFAAKIEILKMENEMFDLNEHERDTILHFNQKLLNKIQSMAKKIQKSDSNALEYQMEASSITAKCIKLDDTISSLSVKLIAYAEKIKFLQEKLVLLSKNWEEKYKLLSKRVKLPSN
ncbi:hypothetical protein A3Q56_00831 [Intoshia linei]|uniref:Uncharacterized protein n=1 Tax=Intoshia linei TaxID=1819745 RepID=A0A177BCJ6_9BILA|nr:hypothetical protein A3Q56_00831 [Intoshia linei]